MILWNILRERKILKKRRELNNMFLRLQIKDICRKVENIKKIFKYI